MVFSDEDKILIKFVFKEVHSKKSRTKHGVNKLLKKLDIATKRNPTTNGFYQSHPYFTKNNYAFECLIF